MTANHDDRQGPFKRGSGDPLYFQVHLAILDDITRSKWKPGDRLPPERELQETFGVSRATIRSALDLLERDGYVVRTHGVGTVVGRVKIQPDINRLTSFTEDLQARGLKAGSVTLDVSLAAPTADVAEAFGITELDKVWHVQRLRFADEEAVGVHQLFIPPYLEFAPGALQAMDSYYALLEANHAIEPFRAVERFTATIADEEQARLLGAPIGAPLLAIRRITYDTRQRPIEYVDLAYRADRYEYTVELLRRA